MQNGLKISTWAATRVVVKNKGPPQQEVGEGLFSSLFFADRHIFFADSGPVAKVFVKHPFVLLSQAFQLIGKLFHSQRCGEAAFTPGNAVGADVIAKSSSVDTDIHSAVAIHPCKNGDVRGLNAESGAGRIIFFPSRDEAVCQVIVRALGFDGGQGDFPFHGLYLLFMEVFSDNICFVLRFLYAKYFKNINFGCGVSCSSR